MKNRTDHIRTSQELVDDNIKFFRTLSSDDIEYTNEAVKVVSKDTIGITNAILDGINNVNMAELFNVPDPRDHFYLRYEDRLFFWHTLYFNKPGKNLTTWDEVLSEPLVTRMIEIAVEEDHKKSIRSWNDSALQHAE